MLLLSWKALKSLFLRWHVIAKCGLKYLSEEPHKSHISNHFVCAPFRSFGSKETHTLSIESNPNIRACPWNNSSSVPWTYPNIWGRFLGCFSSVPPTKRPLWEPREWEFCLNLSLLLKKGSSFLCASASLWHHLAEAFCDGWQLISGVGYWYSW